jgi:hypothetical protein
MIAKGLHNRFLIVAIVSLVAFGSFAGAALADSAPNAPGASLSATGAAAPSQGASSYAARVPDHVLLVRDGGFENGPPPASLWREKTNTTCEWILDPTPVWGIPAHTGTYAFWAGGYCGPANTNQISQPVKVRPSHPVLQFYAVYFRPDMDDPPAVDRFYVQVGNTTVFSKNLIQANDTYPNWVLETVDLSAYADQTVKLSFGARSVGELTGNVLVDDVAFGH